MARMTRRVQLLAVIGLLAGALPAPTARATWSIVAVDPHTREVGIAGASCTTGSEVIAGLAPGRGAIAAQAFSNLDGRNVGARMLADGASPQQVIASIASRDFDSLPFLDLYQWRQYGVAALGFEEAPASFTGESTLSWSGAITGYGVSVQGNTLRGPEVVEQALARFETAGGVCATLADRLMAALVAGSAQGGDRRCVEELAALSAFLIVARPDDDPDTPQLRFIVTRPGEAEAGLATMLWRELRRILIAPEQGRPEENPVAILHGRYTAWRELNPPQPGCARPRSGRAGASRGFGP